MQSHILFISKSSADFSALILYPKTTKGVDIIFKLRQTDWVDVPVQALPLCSGTELALLVLINKLGTTSKREIKTQVSLYPTTIRKGLLALKDYGFIRIDGNKLYSVNLNEECVKLKSTLAELYLSKCITETQLRVGYAILTLEEWCLPITQKQISELLFMDLSCVSKAINSLTELGIVHKEKNQNFTKQIITLKGVQNNEHV